MFGRLGSKKGYHFFEDQDGFEVIAWQDLEDGKKLSSADKAQVFRSSRKKKVFVTIFSIITLALFSFAVYAVVKRYHLRGNVDSSNDAEEIYSSDINAWNEDKSDDVLFAADSNDNYRNFSSYSTQPPNIFRRQTLDPTEISSETITIEENTENNEKDGSDSNDVGIVSKSESGSEDFDHDGDFSQTSDLDPSNTLNSEKDEYSTGKVDPVSNQQDSLSWDEKLGTNATDEEEEILVLYSNEYMEAGQFRYSHNGHFKVGLTQEDGDFVMMKVDQSVETLIWSASTDFGSNWYSSSKPRCFMQSDGNLVLRDSQTKKSIWMTRTHGNPHARLYLHNSGRLSVRSSDESRTIIWMNGIPRDRYTISQSKDMAFPIRGAFYYPWYPSTWYVNGHRAHYNTSLGMYSSSDPIVANAHIEAMDYGQIQLSIASWWGPGTNLDRSRLTMLMDKTVNQNSSLKWTIYHEDERKHDPTTDELREDLKYLKKWFAWHEAWAHIDGKPVIFVYNEGGCNVANRWVQASRGEWYVVLKLFPGFEDCQYQPESWHQYGVGNGLVHNRGHSFVLSPGFWKADTDTPSLERLNQTQFCRNTKRMVETGEPWQLVVSFNEAGEGTLIEPSPNWESDSGYGIYLDCLHEIS